ncbi:hypothetical protein [Mesorhizobium sp. ISC11]|uniref:hypothetical protein n=1 Tax=Mesorhizobium sp. ISC11 TaxID=3076428 RepID=UPI00301C5739
MSEDDDDKEIVLQGNGFSIVKLKQPGTMVPYPARSIPVEGRLNYGWLDLRGRPDLVDQVPEAREIPALAKLLRVLATSPTLMSSACEHGVFYREGLDPPWQGGSFVVIEFLEEEDNTNSDRFVDLAKSVLGGIKPTEAHHIGFDMIVEPLKTFFGRADCFALMIRSLGLGSTEKEAVAAMEHAINAVAESLQRNRPEAKKII